MKKPTVDDVRYALKEFYIDRYVNARFGTRDEITCIVEYIDNLFHITVYKKGEKMFWSYFVEPYVTPKGGLTITDLSPHCVKLLGAFYEN